MADVENSENSDANLDEISLEDIDQLLKEDDPQFAQDMNSVGEIKHESEVDIDLLDLDEASLDLDEEKPSLLDKFADRVPWLANFLRAVIDRAYRLKLAVLRFSQSALKQTKNALLQTKVLLPELVKYILSQLRSAVAFVKKGFTIFRNWPLLKKVMTLLLVVMIFGSISILVLNFKGSWLPLFEPSTVLTFEGKGTLKNNTNQPWVSILRALPQPEHVFLFKKVVVNLRADSLSSSGNPMGLFELYVQLDSLETSAEMRAREKELLDLVQRGLEELSYGESLGEAGKDKIKQKIRSELNASLTQGWVTNVFISNIILKP